MRYQLKKRLFAAVMLLLAGAMIVVGVLKGQDKDVLAKAVMICLECVGIG